MIEKILVPIDGSEVSQKAAQYAVEFAKQTGASLTLLSVIDIRYLSELAVPASASPNQLIESVEDYLKRSAQTAMDAIVKLCEQEGIPCKTILRTGHPVEKIVNEATTSKVDIIVMGSHGKSALKAAVLGSVTYGVMHKEMGIPVLIVRR